MFVSTLSFIVNSLCVHFQRFNDVTIKKINDKKNRGKNHGIWKIKGLIACVVDF